MRVLVSRFRVAAVAAVVAGTLLTPTHAVAAKPSPTTTTHPAVTSGYVANSLRGQYRWLSGTGTPNGTAAPDLYYRDSVAWSRLEPTDGSYDFSYLDDGLSQAAADGGRFGFRVMAWCPGCFTSADPNKAWTLNDWVPSWLPQQSGDTVPDWNSAIFLDAWDALWTHLGATYADDPRLGWIDIGGYGDFGEWHVRRGTPITTANAKRLARAVLDNFPHTHVVVNAMDPTLTNALLAMSPRIGLRTDCLGAPNTDSLLATAAPGSLIANRWRTAPVLSEWCSAAGGVDMVRGDQQVRRYHVSQVGNGFGGGSYAALSSAQKQGFRNAARDAGYRYAATKLTVPRSVSAGTDYPLSLTLTNSGSAPTYDDWQVSLQTTRPGGAVVSAQPLGITLANLRSGSRTYARTVTAPDAPGSYQLRLVVTDPSGYLAPMALANVRHTQAGSYYVGALTTR